MKRRLVVFGGLSAAVAGHAQQFRPDGPQAEAYGQRQGYPACQGLEYLNEQRCRVGALSRFDELFPSRRIAAPAAASPLRRAERELEVRYAHDGRARTLDDYLARRPVSGFLLARGDTILVERYQYGRTDRHRMASFSMAKTVTGLLAGLALQDGAIASIDDLAERYLPELAGTEFGRTPIRALLQMRSGIAYDEGGAGPSSDVFRLAMTALPPQAGSLQAVRLFDRRWAAPGVQFSYSSADSLVLGLVLRGALKRPLADYAAERLWQPLGAEADASWVVDAAGQEIAYAYFNATLRDWARLGLMLAHGGEWNGRTVVPRDWVQAATGPQHRGGYGYQVWINPTRQPTFHLRGLRGQFVHVDPASKTVLVQTAVRHSNDGDADSELLSIWRALIGETVP